MGKIEKPKNNDYLELIRCVLDMVDAVNSLLPQEPAKDREWTAEERDAAEHPRVGDRWKNSAGIAEVIKVGDGLVFYKRKDSEMNLNQERFTTMLKTPERDYLLSRGPEPEKPELRDGDVGMINGIPTIIYTEPTSKISFACRPHSKIVRSDCDSVPFNIYDVVQFFKDNSGGRLLMVPAGKVGVTLTWHEANSITKSPSQGDGEYASAQRKIAAAMEGKPC